MSLRNNNAEFNTNDMYAFLFKLFRAFEMIAPQ